MSQSQAIADSDAIFREAVERSLQRASTTDSTRGLRPLQVRKEPEIRARPDIARTLSEVPDDLRAKIRGLVSGKLPWPLYLFGEAGLGKTCASLVMLDHMGADALGVRLTSCSEPLKPWLAGFIDVRSIAGIKINADKGRYRWGDKDGDEVVRWDRLMRVVFRRPLVVFEEIGVGREAADFRLDALLEVLEQRANNPVRPFVVTSNIKPSEVATIYDDRVADRILCGTVHKMEGASRRMK